MIAIDRQQVLRVHTTSFRGISPTLQHIVAEGGMKHTVDIARTYLRYALWLGQECQHEKLTKYLNDRAVMERMLC